MWISVLFSLFRISNLISIFVILRKAGDKKDNILAQFTKPTSEKSSFSQKIKWSAWISEFLLSGKFEYSDTDLQEDFHLFGEKNPKLCKWLVKIEQFFPGRMGTDTPRNQWCNQEGLLWEVDSGPNKLTEGWKVCCGPGEWPNHRVIWYVFLTSWSFELGHQIFFIDINNSLAPKMVCLNEFLNSWNTYYDNTIL